MLDTYSKFPDILLSDSTYKVNELDMPLYAMVTFDGNGDTKPVCLFLVNDEEEDTITSMVQVFKSWNSTWTEAKVVLTDKDMVERNVFKKEMPHIRLQLCLFHVKRNFKREITSSAYTITQEERLRSLKAIEDMIHARDEVQYLERRDIFRQTCPSNVNDYFEKNWHPIREQWVVGLVKDLRNFTEFTTNRVERFFGTLKKLATKKQDIKSFIRELLTLVNSLSNEKTYKNIRQATTVPLGIPSSNCPFKEVLTTRALETISPQFSLADYVTIIDDTTVKSQTGCILKPTLNCCTCQFFKMNDLPCRHMLKLAQHNNTTNNLIKSIRDRHKQYFYTPVKYSQKFANTPSFSISKQTPTRNCPLTPRTKLKKVQGVFKAAITKLTTLGTEEFNTRLEKCREFVDAICSGKDFLMVEGMLLSLNIIL